MRDFMITRRRGRPDRRWRGAALAVLIGLGAAGPAQAQFNFFGSREVSPDDVSDTIAEHGFQLVGPLYRNGRVYLADVIDRRRHRERLVISAETGQIVQRFLVDVGPERQAPAPAARAPRDDSFFSHLTRGWDDEPPPRPPLGLDEPDRLPAAPPRPRPQPKVVTRTEAPPAAVTATPLPPSTAVAPSPSAVPTKPEVVAVPAPGGSPATATAPSSVRGTSVSTDPLRIPGTRKPEEPKPAPAAVAATAKAPDPTPAAPAPAPVTAKPKPAAPAQADVPVAPLD